MYRKQFEATLFKHFVENLFEVRLKHKQKGIVIKETLMKN